VTGVDFLDPDPDKFQTLGKFPPQPAGSTFPADSSARPHSGTQTGCAAGQRGATVIGEQNRNFTPNQYLDAYGISQLHKSGFKGQGRRMAVIEIDGFKRSDIEAYGACYGKRVPPTKVHLVGIKQPLAPGAETTLDLEVITAVAPQLAGIDVYQGSGSEAGIMLMVGRALTPAKKPAAISISLGGCEPNLRNQMNFRRALDNLFAVAAGAGITVVVAAGDTGSAACALKGNSAALPLATVSDPASSKWVTAAGGTNFELNAQNQISREFTWNDGSAGLGGGGGGLSLLATSRPWYQQGTKRFRNYGLTRALPDVVALADSVPGYSVYCTAPGAANGCENQYWPEGGWQPVGGTSAATPLTASLITLVSQKLGKQGKKPIGFANPLLYKLGKSKSYGSVFRDIVAGNNDVGPYIPAEAYGGSPLGCCYTKTGFDLASGWGSIKATGLAKAAAKHAKRK
jgi:kumamolisin